jgi:molybdopterin converting factor small subunit
MKKSSKLTKDERKEYIKERIKALEEWKAWETERFSRYTEAEMRKFNRECMAEIKYDSKQTREKIAKIDEINRLTMDPNFDERAFEEEMLGRPYDDDECYTPDGYYVFADRYDEAAKQRPPIRKNRPQTPAQQAQPEPEPRVARERVACTA